MAETVTPPAPITKPSINGYTLDYLTLDVGQSRILCVVKSDTGETIQKVYDSTTTPTGLSLLSTLNKSNFTTNSLIKAVFNRLIADGVIAGTVSGTPV
jgi:hypothetical protein